VDDGSIAQVVNLTGAKLGFHKIVLLFWQRMKPLNHLQRIGVVGAEAGLGNCDRLGSFFPLACDFFNVL
jgi:hypothetical protein